MDRLADGRFLIEESYTTGSERLQGENADPYQMRHGYYLSVDEHAAHIERISDEHYGAHFFYYFSQNSWNVSDGKMTFPLSLFNEMETTVKGWKTTFDQSESYQELFAKNVQILHNDYGSVNVIVDNVPM